MSSCGSAAAGCTSTTSRRAIRRRGALHHIGIRSDDLRALVARLKAEGVPFRSEIREFGTWRYIMCAAPDDVLLELFEFDPDHEPSHATRWLREE